MRLTALSLALAVLVTAFSTAACGGNDAAPTQAFDVSSLQLTDTVVGSGAQATAGRFLNVHYTGWLYNPNAAGNKGTQFDSSRTRNQTYPFVLGAGSVIRGWDQGVLGMRVGGLRTLIIPSSLGYGSQGSGQTIPPNSALVFEIELVSVQ